MNQAEIGMGLTIVAVGAALTMGPRLSRKGLYFGISVAPDFAASAVGRRIFRNYALSVALASAIAVGLGAIEVKMLGSGLGLMLVSQVLASWWARHQTRPHRCERSGLRAASLETRTTTLPGGWLAWLVPLAVPVASMVLAARHWASIPLRVPVHYGVGGEADRWVAKTWWGVNAMPLMALSVSLALVIMSWHLAQSRHVSPQGEAAASESSRQRFSLLMLLGVLYMINALFGAIMLQTLQLIKGLPPALPLAILAAGFVAMLGLCFHYARRRRDVEPPLDGTDDDCWHFGMFYANRRDPAVLVEQRLGFGYTLNFGRPAAWGILALAIGPGLAMSLLR